MPLNKKSFLNASKKTCVLMQDKGFSAKKFAEVVGNINIFNRCDRKLKRLFKTNRQDSARQLMNLYNEGDPNPIGLKAA